MKRTEIVVLADAAALAAEGARRVAELLREGVAARGSAAVALAGGSTPRDLYRVLAAAERVPWERTEVFWGDERCVPPEFPASNYRMAHETLLREVPIPPAQVHRIRVEEGAEAAADAYDALLRGRLGDPPRLDVALLGVGTDGHVASLFPGHPGLQDASRLAVAVPGTHHEPARVTLTLRALNAARVAIMVVSGTAKAPTLRQVIARAGSPLPAARVAPRELLVWLLDVDAARGPHVGR